MKPPNLTFLCHFLTPNNYKTLTPSSQTQQGYSVLEKNDPDRPFA